MRRALTILVVGAVAVILWPAVAAQAHGPGATLVRVRVVADADRPTLRILGQVPLDRIDAAYDTSYAENPGSVTGARDALADLVLPRVSVSAGDEDWSVAVESLRAGRLDGVDTLRVELTATGPAAETVALRWEVVTDVVYSHKVYVGQRDRAGETQLAGLVTHYAPSVALTVDDPSAAEAGSMFAVGFEHFREGPDHLLFLCLVGLAAARRRSRLGATIGRLAVLTLTFTVGHSASLALASTGLVDLPSRWVETGIAATILLAAGHAVRPVLPARAELTVTAAFGLIHGFGFAGQLDGLSLSGAPLLVPVLTFNLGLEAAQLLALVLITCQLWLIARSRAATAACAATVALVALAWVAQRALEVANPLDPVVATVLADPERLAFVLLAVALLVVATRRVAPPEATVTAPPPVRVG